MRVIVDGNSYHTDVQKGRVLKAGAESFCKLVSSSLVSGYKSNHLFISIRETSIGTIGNESKEGIYFSIHGLGKVNGSVSSELDTLDEMICQGFTEKYTTLIKSVVNCGILPWEIDMKYECGVLMGIECFVEDV